MALIEFEKNSFTEVIQALLPISHADFVLDAIEHNSQEEADFDEIALYVTGEKAEKEQPTLLAVKQEIFDYFCTDSLLYSDIREATITPTQLVTVITEQVSEKLKTEPEKIAGAVTVALIGATKLGKDKWCENKM